MLGGKGVSCRIFHSYCILWMCCAARKAAAWTNSYGSPTRMYKSSTINYRLHCGRSIATALAASESGDSSALTSNRISLNRIFNSERAYLFTTKRNVRAYEWTADEELEDLFESILSLESDFESELELNALTIMPTKMTQQEKKSIGLSSQVYDVHDGQQRLVSLSLIFAAMRECFESWSREFYDIDEEKSMEYAGFCDSVAKAIFPTEQRLQPVARIETRDKDSNKLLHYILSKRNETGVAVKQLELPSLRSRKGQQPLSQTERRILEAYDYCLTRVRELGPEGAIDMLVNIRHRVFVLVCIPSSTRMARNLVMGLSKGKNLEPVDEFKGLVCFTSIADETLQDETLEKWNALADDVGKCTLEAACLLFAQANLQKRVQRNGEVDIMEEFLKSYLARTNADGSLFFHEKIVPASTVLRDFREDRISLVGKPEERPSLSFLRSACLVSKEIELVVLHYLIAWNQAGKAAEKLAIERSLRKLERVALWMMLAKPKPLERLKRCFAIMKGSADQALELQEDECLHAYSALDDSSFGSTASGIKIAKAILERLNEYELIVTSQGRLNPFPGTLQLEHVLPQRYDTEPGWNECWADDYALSWLHRVGNLALLNQKVNAKISNGPFSVKKEHLQASPYPLTRRIGQSHRWDTSAVQTNHDYVMGLAVKVWRLDP